MGPTLNDAPSGHYVNDVGVDDGCQAMGDDGVVRPRV
jgi:hypothetical protein